MSARFEEESKVQYPAGEENGGRSKARSDLTGLLAEPTRTRTSRADRRTVSDMAALFNDPNPHPRRQKTTSDVVVMFGYAPTLGYADLNMAEEIAQTGTHNERAEQGINDDDFNEKIEHDHGGGGDLPGFKLNHEGLTSLEAEKLLAIHGPNELPEKTTPKWLIFLRLLWAPMPIMIWIAVIIEAGIGNWADMSILLLIQFANASISFYETTKAGDAIAALKNSLKPLATVKRDGKWNNMDARLVVPGDTVLLASGSAIPADCRLNHGEIDVDQAALTGESLPVTFYKLDSCKMGSTVVRGEVEATVEFTGANTFFGKTASLLQDTGEYSHLQKILMTIMIVLVFMSVTLCIVNFVYLLAKGVGVEDALSFTIVLLVASIPLAIEIVTTTTLAIGSKNLVKHGAIVAKLAAIEELAGMSILCSDKTGTLTLNQMVLQEDTPIFLEGENQATTLMYAALAAKWHEPARDALDRLTLGAVNYDMLEPFDQTDYVPFDPTVKRTEGTVVNRNTGETFKTSKGAPHIILKLLPDGTHHIKEEVEQNVSRLGAKGIRSLAVARTSATTGEWQMVGLLTFLDPPRPDTKQTLIEARGYGVAVKMITGDHLLIAKNTAEALEMGGRIFGSDRLPMLDPDTKQKPPNLGRDYGDFCLIADGFAQVYPEHKYLIVECLRELGYTVGMTGDGVNDAPALKRADVGIAVAGATDAARAAADIVLTEEGLNTIIHGIVIAREIFARIGNFVNYRIAATLQLLFFFFIAVFAFHPNSYQQPPGLTEEEAWPEFFHMPVLMLMLITLLNDGTLITIAYDYAQAGPTPCRWNLPALFLTSSVLGAVSCGSSLLLLWFVLDSWNPSGLFQKLGLNGVEYGQITSAIYLKVSVSDFLTLFSARTGDKFFYQVKPAPMLLSGGVFALSLSSILSITWPESNPDDIPTEGLKNDMGLFVFVWLFCLVFWVIQDCAKVLAYKCMYKYNFNDIMTSGVVVLPESAENLIKELEMA